MAQRKGFKDKLSSSYCQTLPHSHEMGQNQMGNIVRGLSLRTTLDEKYQIAVMIYNLDIKSSDPSLNV